MLFGSMKHALIALVALAACKSSPPPDAGPDPAKPVRPAGMAFTDWGDIDRLSGQFITVEGVFHHIRGTHAYVDTGSGLYVYLPHFDLFRRDDAWLEYENKRVWVSGLLHSYTRDIPGYQGPSLELTSGSGFGVIE
jgi:hypothetical protein